MSRIGELREKYKEGLELSLPDCEAEYLVPLFFESGMSSSDMGGMVELSWEELKAWISCTQRDFSLWEINTLKNMSKAYVNEYNQASDANRSQPYSKTLEVTQLVRDEVASSVKSLFAKLKNKE